MAAVEEAKQTTSVRLGALLDASDGAVVTLVAGETRLVAHRAVLAARSHVFAAMLRDGALEASSGQVAVPDVEGPVLQQLLVHLYTLQAPQLPDMAPQLLVAADRYGLSLLKAQCEQQVAAQLSVETAAAAAVLAVGHSCSSLRQAAVAFIKANLVTVMATQGWADAVRNQSEDLIEVSRLLSDPPAETRLDKSVAEAGNTLSGESCLQELTGDKLEVAAHKPAHLAGNDGQAQVFCTQENTSCNIYSLREKEFHDYSCSSSKQSVSAKYKLHIHGVQAPASNCTLCDEEFVTPGGFSAHSVMLPRINEQKLQHDRINNEFHRPQSYEAMCTDETSHKSDFPKSSTTADNLKPHRSGDHAKPTDSNFLNKKDTVGPIGRIHKHEVCEKSTAQSYKVGKLIQPVERPHKCDDCGKSFRQSNHLKKHKLVHIPKGLHKCHVCGKCFSKSTNLKAHVLTHMDERPYKCEGCGKSFTLYGNLQMHTLTHIFEITRKCDVCGESFTQLTELQTHKLTHAGHKLHLCHVCGKSFTRSSNLKKHILIHSGKRPHKCSICGKSFTTSGDLNQHTLVHTGERPHKCGVCRKSFNQSVVLQKHSLKHTSERPQ